MLGAPLAQGQDILLLATTTSTENSGLLAVLHPAFGKKCNCRINTLAVGSGKALKLGKNGDVDAVLVHAPKAELDFVAQGYGINRTAVMHNDFVLVGADNDPANIKQAKSIKDAMQRIAVAKAQFISRGDDSGTHKKEIELWQMAGITPSGDWYIQAGQGMAVALKIAEQKQAYTLADRGTYLAMQNLSLTIVLADQPPLHNPYHIMAVNPAKHPHIRHHLAKQYSDFITSAAGQAIISGFKIAGQQLFYADAVSRP